jgi:hypothetical protein
MTTPKASGPLWAWVDDEGVNLKVFQLPPYKTQCSQEPVRVIPGHGKMVPVELVDAIRTQWESEQPVPNDKWVESLDAIIDAAIRGAI